MGLFEYVFFSRRTHPEWFWVIEGIDRVPIKFPIDT
jgi:hypothetical protein